MDYGKNTSIVQRNPKDLKLSPFNPRITNKRMLRFLTADIKKNGLLSPIIITEDLLVVDGAYRLMSALKLKWHKYLQL